MAWIETDLPWLTKDGGEICFEFGDLGFEFVTDWVWASSQRSGLRISGWMGCIPFLRMARGSLVFGASPPAVLGATEVDGVLMVLVAGVLLLDAGSAATGT